MRTRVVPTAVAAAAVAASLLSPALASAEAEGAGSFGAKHRAAHHRLTSVGLTSDQRLVEFAVSDPSGARSLGRISGLKGDGRLVGIDFRVQNGKLYGVGDKGGVYTLDDKA
ncbi:MULTISPECIES: DUF4394 domain-containing protein, partial [unclassified Streptomyces]|uniref:DUF4394 domain-containing protein n=1 Tax=unclassified Streptomyces TaxID=2593676 RepID=UPI00131C28BD